MFGEPSGSLLLQLCLPGFHNRNSQRLLVNALMCGGDKALEERMRLVRLAQKFRMKLARHEERMIFQFNHLHQFAVRRQAAEHETGFLEFFAVNIVEFVAMAVTFIHHE